MAAECKSKKSHDPQWEFLLDGSERDINKSADDGTGVVC